MQKVQVAPEISGAMACPLKALARPWMAGPGERSGYGMGIGWEGRMAEVARGLTLGKPRRHKLRERLGRSVGGR